jgi:hypothetical protein
MQALVGQYGGTADTNAVKSTFTIEGASWL